jgi:hypothetical protein
LILEIEPGLSEDSVQVTEEVTEAPNQGSEVFNSYDPSFASEGKPRCITQYFKLRHYAILSIIYIYLALRLGAAMIP